MASKRAPKPTRAQQRARREYVRAAGVTVTPEEVDKISSQWGSRIDKIAKALGAEPRGKVSAKGGYFGAM